MKRLASGFVFAGLLAASSIAPAWAADMPLKAPPLISQSNWTGFYAGGEVGYGWGDRPVGFTPNDPAAALLFSGGPGFPGQQPVVNSVNVGRSGPVGGLEAGYNWQVGQSWVWGVEADISLSGLSGQASGTSVIQSPPLFLQTTTAQQNNDWYGTVRGRLHPSMRFSGETKSKLYVSERIIISDAPLPFANCRPSEMGAGFEIFVDGKPRTYRDVRQTAIEAGIVFKRERPQSDVTVRDVRDNSVTLIDGELIAAFEVLRKR